MDGQIGILSTQVAAISRLRKIKVY